MPLINHEVNLILAWCANFVIVYTVAANQGAIFAITKAKLYVPVATLSIRDNAKLLQQLKSGFKRIINWNKYLSKPELSAQNTNFNDLVKSSFQGVNRLFVLAFEDDAQSAINKRYIPNVEIKDSNVLIDGENIFDQPIKNNKITYENILKIATSQGNYYTVGCLLDYTYFKDSYKMIPIDLSKNQAVDVSSRIIQQSNFTANLDRASNIRIFFILEKAKEAVLDFSQGTVKVL